jgi:hypothetical protein
MRYISLLKDEWKTEVLTSKRKKGRRRKRKRR